MNVHILLVNNISGTLMNFEMKNSNAWIYKLTFTDTSANEYFNDTSGLKVPNNTSNSDASLSAETTRLQPDQHPPIFSKQSVPIDTAECK